MALWTTTELLTSVKLKAMTPSNDLVITDANILSLATDELMGMLAPIISSARAQYYETVYDQAVVAGQRAYAIPDRALGGRILNVMLVDSAGNETAVQIVDYSEEAARFVGSGSQSSYIAYVRDNSVVFVSEPTTAVTVRMVFYIRPGSLVATSSARQITVVGGSSVTISSSLSGLTTGIPFDVISNKPIFSYRSYDSTATVAGSTLTFTPPTGTAVDDWVALAGTSPIPQVPFEMHPILTQRTAARVLGILGDKAGMEMLSHTANEQFEQILQLVSPRVAGAPQYIVSTAWAHSRRRRGY